MTTPHVSFGIPTFGEHGGAASPGWRALLDLARAAEDAGVDRLVVSDHVVLGPNTADYPWGRFPTGPTADWLEPLTVIAALAATTDRVRFLTGVLVAPLRPAALLAKTVATVDALSGGRVDLGVGVGWQREEFDAVGADFVRRGELLDRTMADCRTLWAGDPLEVTGADGASSPVWCAPAPAQDRLPVWFSGTLTARNRRRIVELGDGWIPIMGATADDLAAGTAVLRDDLRAAGRDPGALQVRASLAPLRHDDGRVDLAATVAPAAELVTGGATDLHLPLRALAPDALADIAGAGRTMAEAVAAVRTALG